jgi:hypothetical protein
MVKKSEYRISKFETISKLKCSKFETTKPELLWAKCFWFRALGVLVSGICFGFRYSDFEFSYTLGASSVLGEFP